MCRSRTVANTLLLALIAAPVGAQLPGAWHTRGVGGGGALFSPSFSPHNPEEVFLACDLGAFFHSTNSGAAWDLVDFRQIQGNRDARVQYTSNPSLLFCLDYTSLAGNSTVRPSRSLDGGKTWQPLGSDPTGQGAFSLFADINATNRLLVSDYGSVYFSANGGASFSQKFSTNSANGCLVGGAFWDGSNVFVGTSIGLMVSTNNGTTFFRANVGGIPATQAIYSFAGAKQGATTRLWCATLDSGSVYPGVFIEGEYASFGGLYVLDWGQANWTLRTTGLAANNYPVFVGTCLTNITTAYAAGQDNADNPVLYKTTNGGTNWTSVLLTANNQNVFTGWAGQGGDRGWSYGAGALGLGVAPFDVKRVAFSDLGFCHMTANGGTFWSQRYVNPADQNPTNAATPTGKHYRGVGLEDTTCWDVCWANSNRLMAAFSDIKGILSTNAGTAWSFAYTGHSLNSMYRCVRHANGRLYAATASVHDMYQSTRLQDSILDPGTGLILVSTNNGSAWFTLNNPGHVAIWVEPDPTLSTRLYASVVHSSLGGIYVSTNIQNLFTSTWTKMPSPPRTQGHAFNIRVLNDGTVVCSFSGRRDSVGAFTASSGVFLCTNPAAATPVWLDRSDANMQYWTKDVVINPYAPGQSNWFACVFNGWGGPPNDKGGIYRTTNRGITWQRLADNSLAPSGILNVESCVFHPTDSNTLFFTTELDGMWASTNIDAAVPTFFAVTNYPYQHPVRLLVNPFNSNEAWATSFGNGLRVASFPTLSLSPLETWRAAHFGANTNNPAISGNLADPDGDGVQNLLEYALNTDPLVASTTTGLVTMTIEQTSGTDYLTLTVQRNSAATDVQFIAEVAGDLPGWQSGSSFTTTLIDTATLLKVRDNVPVSATQHRFIRLRVQ